MSINKCSDECVQISTFLAAILCVLIPAFSTPANAIIVDGSFKGIIHEVDTYVDDGDLDHPFFEAAVEGLPFRADFWYEFDESKFPVSDGFRQYSFDFSSIALVVEVGGQHFSSVLPGETPLIHLWNTITISRGNNYSYFDLTTYSVYSGIRRDGDTRMVGLNLDSAAMEYFSGFDLAQNISLSSSGGAGLGYLEVRNHGTRYGNRYPGDTDDYTYILWGEINSVDMRVRSSVVDESGSLGLIMLALLCLGGRYYRQ